MAIRMSSMVLLPLLATGLAFAEGGETIQSATEISSLPYVDTGNTCDNLNDYDEICPWSGSTAPDVVYSFSPAFDMAVDVDLCQQAIYDTKLYLYAGSPDSVIACNDDGCGVNYQSRIEAVSLAGGTTYYVVVDGYGAACGDYTLVMTESLPCIVQCPEGAHTEDEPPCEDGYDDVYNSGCIGIGWTSISAQLDGCADMCGRSCTYEFQGEDFRDQDWYRCFALGGLASAEVEAEFEVVLSLIYVADCDNIVHFDYVYGSPCSPVMLSRSLDEDQEFWLTVAPSQPTGVPESSYVLRVCGIREIPVAAGSCSWGAIKEAFRVR